ncbi:hypothetical protein Tco_0150856 [Tanacetum coccineum]
METKGTKSANYMMFINANVLSNFVSLQCLSSLLNALLQNTMAEQNVPAQPPTRTDEQIISVDILSNTNFFQAFTASANVPAIYLQQFWKTMSYNEKTGVYSCQLDEQWFDLSADLLRKALAITPVNPTHPFELPPSGDTVIDFVNELGYPEPVEIVSSIRTNYVYQPWRAILSLLNQCLTGKTSGSDKPRHPVLQMLWGIVTQTNVDHAELIWEEFTQGIQTFFSHKASHKASLKNPKKKVTPLLIPYGRFSKVIIYYLASNNNIHRRLDSAVHHTGDDYIFGNLKFVPKGESVEVFGMAIPDPLITEAIQQSSYYPKYLKMVAENTKKTPRGSASVQPATQRDTPKKPTTTTPVKQTKTAPPPTKKPSKHKLSQKVRKGKPAFQLVDEEDEAQQESIPQREDDDPDLELAKKLSLETPQEKGEGEGDDADLEQAIKLSLDPAFLPQGRAPIGGVKIRDLVSEATPKLHEVVGKGKAVFILVRRDQTPPDSTTGPSSQPEDDTSEKVIHESSSTSNSERTESDTETGAPKGDKVKEATTFTHLSGITPFIALQLRVARLEQEMSEVKKTDHSADVLASIRSQVPTAVDKLSRTKLDDALLKSPKEIIKAKKEQDEEKQDSTYSIRSTDKVDLEEFDLKTLDKRNEDAMDKEVADKVKDHKRKHDSDDDEDDDDDEGPLAGSNQDMESDASASKQHPALTSTGWQITDTRDAGADSSMYRSDPESEQSEQSSDDISMQE